MITRKSWRNGVKVAATALAVLAGLSLGGAVNSGRSAEPRAEKPNRYIGAKKCKNCHSANLSGDQFEVWSQARHSKAFETLASDKARQLAAERGIADPQKSDECIRCHTSGHGEDKKHFKSSFDPVHGVQCETCHGPGEKHLKARFAAVAEESEPQSFVEVEKDEITRSPGVDVCVKCHNQDNPNHTPFCFHTFRSKIRHLNPRKPRTEAERVALDACECPEDCVCFTDGMCGKS